MPFEEAVGRLKAYEERLKSHDEKEEEHGGLLLTSSGFLEEEEVRKEVLVEEKEDVEEVRFKVIRVGLDAMSIMEKFKSIGLRFDEEVSLRKLLKLTPKKYLPIIASIEQYSKIETMSFEEAVGRLKAYEERLKSHDEKEEEHGGLLLTSSGFLEEEEVGKEILVEEKEDVEEVWFKVIRVGLDSMSVEHLNTS
nr:zinc finger, CCHC-type [Tanacetum cinerariifolium]